MRKDHLRDYATAAFRFYARTGGEEKYIKHLQDAARYGAKGSGVSNPTEGALIKKENIIRQHAAEFEDIKAVEKTLAVMQLSNGIAACKAVEMVYFKDCWKELEKGDIENRVHYAELHIPASRRQIYYWLSKARKLFAYERGLRI